MMGQHFFVWLFGPILSVPMMALFVLVIMALLIIGLFKLIGRIF